VSNVLNREDMSQYKLLVQAVDNYDYGFLTGESRKAFHTITVTVTDVNDETPTIVPQTSDCAVVNEFHPIRDMITYVTAIDGDDGMK
jgi:cadherin 23